MPGVALDLSITRPRLVAVVNVTPDSFSDGGRLADVAQAVAFALRCVADGAEILDVGGESTRPDGARRISAEEEIRRVLPVVEALSRAAAVPISIDTTKAAVARAALAAGATVVNDISGGRFEPEIVGAVEAAGASYVLGHLRGGSLQAAHAGAASPPGFDEVRDELGAALAKLPAGVRARTVVDPGLGFGKRGAENLPLIARAGELALALGRPVMLGPSRKRFLGELCGREVDQRDDATVGACLAGAAAGAHFLRVHDVRRVHDALLVFEAVRASSRPAPPGAGGQRP